MIFYVYCQEISIVFRNFSTKEETWIYGKNQDRNEAIFDKNYGYGSEFRVWLLIYHNRSLFEQAHQSLEVIQFFILSYLLCYTDSI